MAERNVTVRLRAVTDQYKKAMGDASKATQGLVDKAGGMQALGGKMQAVGGTLTRSVTLPMIALGGVASKLSLDFEATFSRMVGLAGVTAGEVDGLKESVLGLAGETTRPPQELAEALYFIRSAGLDGQDALDALEMSAKGAAAGLGSTVVVADAVTSAMNAYGSNVLSAAEATDVLAATAEQGKVEASALAGQFGRMLPIASELGISFDQVGGAMGFLTRTSGSAELAATQLGGVLAKLLEPGEKGRKTLEKMGMSMDDIRASVREKGLLVTLEELRNKLAANGMEFSNFAEDQQFLQGALMLTGKSFESAQETMDAVAGSAGKTEEAFAAFAETAGFKNKQAFADLQAALISLGDVLVPLIANIAEFGAALFGAFNALPGPMKTAVVSLGAMLALVGPLASIGGTIAKNWALMGIAFDKAAISAYNAAGGLGAMMATAGALAAAFVAVGFAVKSYNDQMAKGDRNVDEHVKSLVGGFDAAVASASEFEAQYAKLETARKKHHDAGNNAVNPFLIEQHRDAADAIYAEQMAMKATGDMAKQFMDTLGLTADEALRMATDVDVASASTDAITGEFDAAGAEAAVLEQQIEDTAKAFSDLSDELAAQFDPLFGAQDAMMDLAEAQHAAAEAAKVHGKNSKEAAEANDKVVRAALANEQAQLKLRSAIEAGDVQLDDAIATLNRWVAEGHITQEQADAAAWSFHGLAEKANAIPKSIGISIGLTGYDAVLRQLDAISSRYNSEKINIKSISGQSIPRFKVGGAVPGGRNEAVPAVLHGGEHVLSADIVDAIKNGRPTAGLPALASVGAASGGGDTIVIHASALEARQVAKVVVDAIETAKRGGY